ncbi:MAG: hypothetical protein QW682_04675 [Nitrososphaerota archaeon]
MSLKEEFIELLEKDKSFRFTIAGLIGYKDILERLEEHDKKFNEISKRLEEHDKKFNEIIIELRELRKNFELLSNKVEVTIGSMGMRWAQTWEEQY